MRNEFPIPALELAASIGLQNVSLEFGGFGGSGAIYVWIVGFAVLAAWSIAGSVVSYINARRYRNTWKYSFGPAITTTLWFFSTLYVVHFAHLMMVGFATAPMPAREIRIDADWDAIQPTLAAWQKELGYERAEYADFVLRDDEETVVGEFHQLRYEARSWFDGYQASWQYMLQRRRPALVVSVASRKKDPVTVLKVAFPQLRRYSPENRLIDSLLGKWKLAEIADPLRKPNEMDGQAEFKRVSMDMFVEEQLRFGGPQFAIVWRGVYGFDPLRKKFTATWFTNLNTIAFQGVADVLPKQNIFSFRLSHPLLTKIEEATGKKSSFVYRITVVDQQQLKFQLIEVVGGPNAVTETVQWQVVATKPIE